MERNSQLKEHLEKLSQFALLLYEQRVGGTKPSQEEWLHVFIKLGKLDQEIFGNSEFNHCINLMKNDENIQALQGQLVGTCTGKTIVENEKVCILSFVQQLYFKSPQYQKNLYDLQYQHFEDLFYSDVLLFVDSVKLYNFESEVGEIVLEDGLRIKKKIPPIGQNQFDEHFNHSYANFSKSNYLLEREFYSRKEVGNTEDVDNKDIEKQLSETSDLFDLVIVTLRVFKTSAVFRDHRTESELITFHPHGGRTIRSPFFENTVIGKKCEIKSEDIIEIKNIFEFIKNEKESRFIVAQRRLADGLTRKAFEDKLIDYMIGLEALYLPDGNQELSFRLSLRVAFLLAYSSDDRKKLFSFIKEMYKTRSNIVHGSKYELNEDSIIYLEDLLRKSLKLWIEERSNFSVNKFTNSGNLKSEGKLDNMFFEL